MDSRLESLTPCCSVKRGRVLLLRGNEEREPGGMRTNLVELKKGAQW